MDTSNEIHKKCFLAYQFYQINKAKTGNTNKVGGHFESWKAYDFLAPF